MNRCITERLALLGRRCLTTSTPHQFPTTSLSRTLWTSAHHHTVPHPDRTVPSLLCRLSRRLSLAAGLTRQLCRSAGGAGSGGWHARLPRRLSDRAVERCGLALAASWFTMLTVQSECDQVDFELLVKNKLLNPDEEQTGWDRLAAMYTLE